MDVEWEPAVGRNVDGKPKKQNPASLLQLSNGNQIFLVDLRTLLGGNPRCSAAGNTADNESGEAKESEDSHEDNDVSLGRSPGLRDCAAAFLHDFFSSTEIVKLGFALAGDLKKLRASYPTLNCFHNGHALLNLDVAARHLYGNPQPCSARKRGVMQLEQHDMPRRMTLADINLRSLSTMCESFLGLPLDKAHQCSSWDRRPLLEEQVRHRVGWWRLGSGWAADLRVCVYLLYTCVYHGGGGGEWFRLVV